jgi:flagellar motor switch protein FliG
MPPAPARLPEAAEAAQQALKGAPRKMSGVDKAAIVLLVLGDRYGAPIWQSLEDDEIRMVSQAMSQLGSIDSADVERILGEFYSKMAAGGAVTGDYDRTEILLQKLLPKDRASSIMEEIRGPGGRNMWQKLSNIQDQVLANFLKNEYPQTVAVILSKIKSEHAARVLAILPDDFALEVVARMLKMEAVQKDVLDRIEETLRSEFIGNLSLTHRRDAHELMAEVFNSFDRQTEMRFLSALDEKNREAAARIRALMFTFDDLVKLDPASIQVLLRNTDKEVLGIALKGASEPVRNFFLGNMSTRAAKNLGEEMSSLGPLRLKQIDEAQSKMVALAKDLAGKGEIVITKNRAEDELVY